MEMAIGYFGDARLEKNGALIAQRVSERQAVCVRKLADDRSEQVKFRRFLSNEAVTVEEMVAHRARLVAAARSPIAGCRAESTPKPCWPMPARLP